MIASAVDHNTAARARLMEDRNMEETTRISEGNDLREQVEMLKRQADSFVVVADRVLAEKKTTDALAVSHADLCTKMVHVDSVEKAVGILSETALGMERVDSVAVWVERHGEMTLVDARNAMSGVDPAECPVRGPNGKYDLSGLAEARLMSFSNVLCYYPVPIYHPGNGEVGVAEYASTEYPEFPQVLKRVLCGITDTAATVIGRLTICDRLTRRDRQFQALSKASMEAVVVFSDDEVFATNEMFETLVSDSRGGRVPAMVEQARQLARGEEFAGRMNYCGYDVFAKTVNVSVEEGKTATAVVITLWRERG